MNPVNDEPSFTLLGDQLVDEDSGPHVLEAFNPTDNKPTITTGTRRACFGNQFFNFLGNSYSFVKTTIFITSMNDFVVINKIYNEYFGKSKPARSTVEVSALPKNVQIEIDCIATK